MEPIPGTSNFFDVSDEEGEDEFENYVPLSRETLAEEQSSLEESSDDDLDYVPLHNSSIDSDEPLSEYAQRLRVRNSPGTPGFKWRKRENVPRKFGLTATPGLRVNFTQSDSPHKFLKVFFTEEIMKIIVEETNKYAESNPGFVRGHERKWTPVTIPELAVWVSLRIMMGISPKPRQAKHWSKDELHDSPFFYKHMPRDRYDQISTCLHFSSDGARGQTNRLWKLSRIVELLQQSFKEAYVPPQTITVDEITIYTQVRTGEFFWRHIRPSAEVLDKGYSLYVDNWYSSPTLFHWLQGRKKNACGTVRANRKFMPKDFPNRMRLNDMERSTST
ncbi:piggyBac transposable element-derived protein 4-like, partial [Penaeus japonicus]|uniref:piggyBac transposable element-derived protein 4-like n=1 Tax=Penaeus japonicus TaxID=27405 RepID=UPI001C71019E